MLSTESDRFRHNPDLPKDEKDAFVQLCAQAISAGDTYVMSAAADALANMRYKEGMWRLIDYPFAADPLNKTAGATYKRGPIGMNFPLLLEILENDTSIQDIRHIIDALQINPIDIVVERLTAYLQTNPKVASEIGPLSFPETVEHNPNAFDY